MSEQLISLEKTLNSYGLNTDKIWVFQYVSLFSQEVPMLLMSLISVVCTDPKNRKMYHDGLIYFEEFPNFAVIYWETVKYV